MKKKPIFRKILIPLMGLVILEILILVCTILGQGLIRETNENEEAVINSTVAVRKNYLESTMINDWINLQDTVDQINQITEILLENGKIELETLDDSSENCAVLMEQSVNPLIEMMRSNRVTGAFIVLNTEDLRESMAEGIYYNKPGIYLRDDDPTARPSRKREDVLILRSPRSVVENYNIATDGSWNVKFAFREKNRAYYDFLYYPFQIAYENTEGYEWKDMGYWSAPYSLEGEDKKVISYSVPLILEDGTVYGVLGIDITRKYLCSLLPYQELDEDGESTYFVATKTGEKGVYENSFGSGTITEEGFRKDGVIRFDSSRYYFHEEPLEIYNVNGPFSQQEWVLVGGLTCQTMRSFVYKLIIALFMAIVVTFVIGILGSLLISYVIQRPVSRLSQEIRNKDPRTYVHLCPTGILEIDQMGEAVEKLSRDMLDSGNLFSRIIEMASARMTGFQIDKISHTLFLTEHFFHIFGMEDVDETGMTPEIFNNVMHRLSPYYLEPDEGVNGYIFGIPDASGKKYIRLRVVEDDRQCYGLAEDVTQALLEKKMLEHERDHDALTNLYNRRAFRRKLEEILQWAPEELGIGAFLMLDLDNLKYINDTYGHEYGDQYIMQAAGVLRKSFSEQALYARISGDEFIVFLYGRKRKEEIREQIRVLIDNLRNTRIQLPDGIQRHIRASGGVSWYPEDGNCFEELFKYADYAMYRVKKTQKGEIQEFDREQFENQDIQQKNSAALTRMLEKHAFHYVFQPIVDARTGRIFAWEALMRPDVAELGSVKEILEAARIDGRLNLIEEYTMFFATEAFVEHMQNGAIGSDCYLFLNSLPDERMSVPKEDEFAERFEPYLGQLVIELTEEERINREFWEEKKKRCHSLGCMIALDDYGTGYNSEKLLLSISPDYIKVDIAIVNNIHNSPDRQAIMAYIVNYAHERGKYIVAEGVETAEEARCVISMGVDLLQGFFLAKPAKDPGDISEEAKKVIDEMRKEHYNQ